MKKIACLLYPNFSLYEIAPLTSALVLNFGRKIDFIASTKETIYSEDGLACHANKTLDEVNVEEYDCILCPGMIDFTQALRDECLIRFLTGLDGKSIKIAAISSAPILLAKAGLLKQTLYTGGIWQNFIDYFDFLPRENFRPLPVCEDGNIITGTGFTVNAFSRQVLTSLGLVEDASMYFKENDDYSAEDFIFELSDEEFEEFKATFEKDPN